jgi:hypothetical protein
MMRFQSLKHVRSAALLCGLMTIVAGSARAADTPEDPQVTACKATGLLALQQRTPGIKALILDEDSLTIAKADTKVEDTPIHTIIMGEAYLEKRETGGAQHFLCLIGDKGKVLLTFFTKH